MTKKLQNIKNKCRVCFNIIDPFMSFGEMPIANNLIRKDDYLTINNEFKYSMEVAICVHCACFQVTNVPNKNLMFNNNYAYFASESNEMINHFFKLSQYITTNYLINPKDYILEIGCNDGILLKNFSNKNIPHLGIDASSNLVAKAQKDGINVECAFFDDVSSDQIEAKYGKAKVIVLTNTMHHIENCNAVAKAISALLSEDGTVIIEDPYLVDMINLGSFEQIYAEHNFIWCVSSYKYLFEIYGIYLNDVEHFDKHGGSMRYYFSKNKSKKSDELIFYEKVEKDIKINSMKTYDNFKMISQKICEDLFNFVSDKVNKGYTVCGYGATAKSCTILNYAKINNNLLTCIYDSTPFKINKLCPGSHIPIRDAIQIKEDKPDFTILFAWNHKNEILKKESNTKTTWVEYIPEIIVTNGN